MTIRSKPATQAYRDNYDAIFGDIDRELDDYLATPGENSKLREAYEQADAEWREVGMIGLDLAAKIIELGGDPSNYA